MLLGSRSETLTVDSGDAVRVHGISTLQKQYKALQVHNTLDRRALHKRR